MKRIVAALLVVLAAGPTLVAAEPTIRLTVSGTLASKLDPDTTLQFWNPWEKPEAWFTVRLRDLSADLPAEKLRGDVWHVWFAGKKAVFSVTLAIEKSDRREAIEIALNAPKPRLETRFNLAYDMRYSADIVKGIEYRDLPRWDAEKQRIAVGPRPVIEVKRLRDGAIVYKEELGNFCRGSRWYVGHRRLADKLQEGEKYRASVTYDSGGLFPTIVTTCDFAWPMPQEDDEEGDKAKRK